MPIGLRGVGKTVLLNRFAEIATGSGFEVGFIEAPESASHVWNAASGSRIDRGVVEAIDEALQAFLTTALCQDRPTAWVRLSFATVIPADPVISLDPECPVGAPTLCRSAHPVR